MEGSPIYTKYPFIAATLFNEEWIGDNGDEIRAVLPETWTHLRNVDIPRIGFTLKILGVDWRSDEELCACIGTFEQNGLVWRDGYVIRRRDGTFSPRVTK